MTSAEILGSVAKANLAASAAILLALLLRRPTRLIFGPAIAYGVWLMPLVAALAAVLPGEWLAFRPAGVAGALQLVSERIVVTPPAGAAAGYSPLLLSLWVAGSALSFMLMAAQQRRFTASLGPLTGEDEVVSRAGVSGIGPAIVGALSPRIVIPADFEHRYGEAEREAILAHERAHLALAHPQLNGLIAAFRCLCWFNPLVHLAAHLSRLDQELACDAAVLKARPTLRKPYAAALLKAQLAPTSLPLGCYWPARSPHPLKERLMMLNRKEPGRLQRLGGTAALVLLVGGASYAAMAAEPTPSPASPQTASTLSNARKAPPSPAIITNPDWIQRPTAEEMGKVWPTLGRVWPNLPDGVAATALLTCAVTAEGAVANCVADRESPEGLGLAEAALALAPSFKMKPMTIDGRPVGGGVVKIPFLFKSGS